MTRRGAGGVLLAAVTAQLGVSGLHQGLPAIGPILQRDFGVDTTLTALLLGAVAIGSAITVLAWGRLTDHTTDRGVALAGLIATAAGVGIAGFAAFLGSFPATAAALLAAGLAAAAPSLALTKSLAQAFASTRRIGVAFGLRQAAVPLGGLLAALTLPILALGINLATALWALSLALLLAAVTVFRSVPGNPIRTKGKALGRTPWRKVGPMIAATGLYTAAQGGVLALLTIYLVDSLGWRATEAAWIYGLVMLVTIALRVLIGLAADRWPMRRVHLFTLTGVATAVFLLAAAVAGPTSSSAPLLIAAAILGMGGNALAFTLTVLLVPTERIGTSQGVLNAVIFASWGTAPIVTAAIVAVWSWSVGWVALAALALAGAGIAGTLAVRQAPWSVTSRA